MNCCWLKQQKGQLHPFDTKRERDEGQTSVYICIDMPAPLCEREMLLQRLAVFWRWSGVSLEEITAIDRCMGHLKTIK